MPTYARTSRWLGLRLEEILSMMLYLIGSSWGEAELRLALIVLDSIDLFGEKLSLVGLLWVAVVVQLVCLLLSWKGAWEWILLPKCWLVKGPKLDKILLVGAKHFDIFTQIGYPFDYHTLVTSVLSWSSGVMITKSFLVIDSDATRCVF